MVPGLGASYRGVCELRRRQFAPNRRRLRTYHVSPEQQRARAIAIATAPKHYEKNFATHLPTKVTVTFRGGNTVTITLIRIIY